MSHTLNKMSVDMFINSTSNITTHVADLKDLNKMECKVWMTVQNPDRDHQYRIASDLDIWFCDIASLTSFVNNAIKLLAEVTQSVMQTMTDSTSDAEKE